MPDSAHLGLTTTVEQQNHLVQSYLDSLLSDATAEPAAVASEWPAESVSPVQSPPEQEEMTEDVNQATVSARESQALSAIAPRPEAQVTAEPALSDDVHEELNPEIAEPARVSFAGDIEARDSKEAQSQGRPPWAEETFASLLFEVAGNDLAAPLHELGGICPLADNLKHLAGQADWFLGLLNWNGRQLRVVDTARLIMSETHLDNSLEEDYQSVIILGNSNWALAVNRADQSIRLDPQDVKWREHRGNRYWLAGTLQDQLSSLIDVAALRHYLDSLDVSLETRSGETGMNPASE